MSFLLHSIRRRAMALGVAFLFSAAVSQAAEEAAAHTHGDAAAMPTPSSAVEAWGQINGLREKLLRLVQEKNLKAVHDVQVQIDGKDTFAGFGINVVDEPKATAATVQAGQTGAVTYYCTMHPDVMATKSGASCPKCGGMKLLPKKA